MLRTSGRRIDMSTPFVDAMLPDGWRLHVVIPDVTRPHMAVNIRKFVLQAHSLDELVGLGTLTAQVARFLEASVAAGLNILVSGGTQAGRTTVVVCPAWCVHGGSTLSDDGQAVGQSAGVGEELWWSRVSPRKVRNRLVSLISTQG